MIKIYRNIITKEETEEWLKTSRFQYKFNQSVDLSDNIVKRIVDILKKDFEFEIKPQSYQRFETRRAGHPWHLDTGTNNHMMWCQVGVSLLLQDSGSGGETYYGDDEKGTNAIKSDRNIYDLVAHTSDEWHAVTPHRDGNRIVFLMFI